MSDPDTAGFYDGLAPFYPLLYSDWDDAVARQGLALSNLLAELGIACGDTVLDAACGVGTQALGLLGQGPASSRPICLPGRSRGSRRNWNAMRCMQKRASTTCGNSPASNPNQSWP